MSNRKFSTGVCCPPRAEGLTYVEIGPKRHVVGMMNLEIVFEQLFALNRLPDELSDADIVGMARKFNYIPHEAAIEADYAAALRQNYAVFYAKREKGR